MNVLCLLRFPCWVLRTQNMFPGGPPGPAAHQAASLGSVEDNSPRRLVRCLGLGTSRCEANAVCPQGGTSCPSRGTGDGRVKIAYPSWGSQPLTSAMPGVAPLRSLASPPQPAPCNQGHQPSTTLHAVALRWQLWHCHGHMVWYSGYQAS